jgi:hypothetical protein
MTSGYDASAIAAPGQAARDVGMTEGLAQGWGRLRQPAVLRATYYAEDRTAASVALGRGEGSCCRRTGRWI